MKQEIDNPNTAKFQYIQDIYEEYYATQNDLVFTKLINEIDNLYAKYVRNLLKLNACFNDESEHTALQEARKAIWERILKCREDGTKDEAFGYYCKGIYYHKAMDVIRQHNTYRNKYSDKGGRRPVSLDIPLPDDNRSLGDIVEDKSARPEDIVSKKELRKVFNKLFILYCHSLADADAEPPRELALYYARILPHVLHIDFGNETIPDSKAASAKWAYERIGNETVGNLGKSSENEMKKYISSSLNWCEKFWRQLENSIHSSFGEVVLKDIIYTSMYDKKKIEDWSESMHKAVVKTTAKEALKDSKLVESAIEYISDRDKIYCLIKGGRER